MIKHIGAIALFLMAAGTRVSAHPLAKTNISAHQLAQPLSVSAHSIQISQRTGISQYRGNVTLVQDGITVKAEQVTVHSAHGQVLSMAAIGQPLHFEDQQPGALPVFGQARTMHFLAAKHEVTLMHDVIFRQGVNILHGQRIQYNTITETMTATSSPGKQVRATVVPNTLHHAAKKSPHP